MDGVRPISYMSLIVIGVTCTVLTLTWEWYDLNRSDYNECLMLS